MYRLDDIDAEYSGICDESASAARAGPSPEERAELAETNYDTQVANVLDSTENSVLAYVDGQGRLCNTFVGADASVLCDDETVAER